MKVSITGAGGFIGGHLVNHCIEKGYEVCAYDIKPFEDWFILNVNANNFSDKNGDVTIIGVARHVVDYADEIYNLACNMGGIGFCENNHLLTGLSNSIHQNIIKSILEKEKKPKIFYSSSPCVYNENLQNTTNDVLLKESDAWPAQPDLLYGLEKLFAEELYRYLHKEYGVDVRIARFHNVYGPNGTFTGGKEKAPAAALRKAIEFKKGLIDKIEIWGDGTQKRSFMYIDDAIKGIDLLMESDYVKPLNLGSSYGVTIQYLHDLACQLVDVEPIYEYKLDAPQGVKSRNSDNTKIKEILNWEPEFPLAIGMDLTKNFIKSFY